MLLPFESNASDEEAVPDPYVTEEEEEGGEGEGELGGFKSTNAVYGERGRLEVLEDAAGSASSACWGLLIGRESLLSVGDGEEGGFSPSYVM